MSKKFELLSSCKEALLLASWAAILLGPLLSFKLDGFSLHIIGKNTLWLFLSVFFGKLIFNFIQKIIMPLLTPFFKRLTPFSFTQPSLFNKPSVQGGMILLLGLSLPLLISKYWLSVIILAMIYILLGLGLNIVVGFAGLLNLGFAAFYAVGAYTFALLAQFWHIGFWTALPIALILGGLFGILLAFPILKMQGDYLAIVTLGFGEITRLLLENGGKITGGPNGISVPPPTFFGIEFGPHPRAGGICFHDLLHIPYDSLYRTLFMYFILFALVVYLVKLVSRLQQLPLGRAWEALREDEIACRALGINHVTTKLSAFSIGAMIGSLAGVFFAGFTKFVNPASFTFTESAMILAIVVLGGMGSITGLILAALLLTLLPELLREFSAYRMFLFGIIMVLMMIWRPTGLFLMKRQKFSKPTIQPYSHE